MVDYTIYMRGGTAIEGKLKCPDQLRQLMRAPTTGTFELTDNAGIAIIRTSDVLGVVYEEIPDPTKMGFKKNQ